MAEEEEPHVSAHTFTALMGAKGVLHDSSIKRRLKYQLCLPPEDRNIKDLITMLTCHAPRLLEAFQHANVEQVVRSISWREYEYDAPIFWQGDEADGLYYVMSGAVSIHKKNHNRPTQRRIPMVSDVKKESSFDDDDEEEEIDRIGTFGDLIVELREEKFFGELAFAHSQVAPRRQATVVAGVDDGGLTKEMLGKERMCVCLVVPPQAHSIGQDSSLDEIRRKLSFLRECLLFAHWPLSQHYVLAHTMQHQFLEAGQTLSRLGTRKGMVACIWSGELRVVLPVTMSIAISRRPVYDGHRPPIGLPPEKPTSNCRTFIECAVLGAGEIWGFRDVLGDDQERCQLIASRETVVYFILHENMKNIVDEDPKIKKMITVLGKRRRKWERLREQYARKMAEHNAEDVAITPQSMILARYTTNAENTMDKEEHMKYEAVRRNCEGVMQGARAAHELARDYMGTKEYTRAVKLFGATIEKCEFALARSGGIRHPCIIDAEQYIKQSRNDLTTAKTYHLRQAVAAKIMAKRVKRWCQKRVLMRKAGMLPDSNKESPGARKPRRWRRKDFDQFMLKLESIDAKEETRPEAWTADGNLHTCLDHSFSIHGVGSLFDGASVLTDGSATVLSEERLRNPLTAREVDSMTEKFLVSHDLDFDDEGTLVSTIATPKKPTKPRERPWRRRHQAAKGQILGGNVK